MKVELTAARSGRSDQGDDNQYATQYQQIRLPMPSPEMNHPGTQSVPFRLHPNSGIPVLEANRKKIRTAALKHSPERSTRF
jgi:hypothetical protein